MTDMTAFFLLAAISGCIVWALRKPAAMGAAAMRPITHDDFARYERGAFMHRTAKWLQGCEYGPMLTDGTAYLCPHCGGWGELGSRLEPASERSECARCAGLGEISLDDPRVTTTPQRLSPNESVKPTDQSREAAAGGSA